MPVARVTVTDSPVALLALAPVCSLLKCLFQTFLTQITAASGSLTEALRLDWGYWWFLECEKIHQGELV